MTIASMRRTRSSVPAIDCTLGRSPATTSRELAHNASAGSVYASVPAQALSHMRSIQARAAPQLHPEHVLWGTVLTLLGLKWSPQQIAGILKRVWTQAPAMHVSHETIYRAIYAYPRGELRCQILASMRHGPRTLFPPRQ